MSTLFIDPFSGVSGDMFLGALCDLSGDSALLQKLPGILNLPSVKIQVSRVTRCGISAVDAAVIESQPADAHRHLSDIAAIIAASSLTQGAKAFAMEVFELIAEAEAAVHGTAKERIHFHEVGAIDSIMDVAGSALLLDRLKVKRVFSRPLCTGYGFVKCAHGRMPVPAPASELLLHGIPFFQGPVESEMATPTGIAILKALKPQFDIPVITLTQSGRGSGKKEFSHPNILRIGLIEESAHREFRPEHRPEHYPEHSEVAVIRANIDDASGEILGEFFQNQLFNQGALDVVIQNAGMKKGRPGFVLEVLAPPDSREKIIDCILNETTTIGVRYHSASRRVLPRKTMHVSTEFGDIGVKAVELPGGKTRTMPEYEECRAAAERLAVPLQDVYRAALNANPAPAPEEAAKSDTGVNSGEKSEVKTDTDVNSAVRAEAESTAKSDEKQ